MAMNGIHDMGGMDGFGTVEPEPNEPPFHAPWEGRVLAMNRAIGYAKIWNIDKSRATHRRAAAARISDQVLLPEMGARLEQLLVEYGYRRRGRGGRRPRAASGQAAAALACRPPR